MKYSNAVVTMAQNTIDERRSAAESERRRRVKEIEARIPEIERINAELARSVTDISNAAAGGNAFSAISKIAEKNIAAQEKIQNLLRANGYPEDYLTCHYTCRKCDDTGFVDGIRCSCFDELLRKYAVEELNRNCRIKLRDFNDFDLKYYEGDDRDFMMKTLDMCKRYAAKFSRNSDSILFLGGTGLGKTFLSSAIANEVIQRGYNVAYDSISNFLKKIEDESFGRATGDTLEILLSADLVILDDLGAEFRSSFNDSSIYSIINSRINYRLPTIISSNLSFIEIDERYNERIVSRLNGDYIPITLRGKDIRYQKRMSN